MIRKISLPLFLVALAAQAQVATRGVPFIRATGTASVSIQPDTAKIDLAVTTQASTAQQASSQNATQTSAVIAALQQLLGAGADIKTLSYSVSPVYTYPQNAPPNLVGFTVTNSLVVTVSDLTSVGKVVDTAVAAGATSIQGLTFTLKDDTMARQQALRLAAGQAMTDANAIASGLSVHLGAVLSAIEGTATTTPVVGAAPGASASTPVQPGNLTIQATVTVDMQVSQ
jgi:uncharacterized protein YggE